MKIINNELLDSVTQQAVKNTRLRMNYNFHESLDDPINRLLNAMEPDTYLPPHRHKNPDKNEIFLVLRGKVLIFIFDDEGNILSITETSPQSGVYGMEIEAGVWHSLIVLEQGTVVYEIKEGPYAPISPENLAPWAPNPNDTLKAKEYTDSLIKEYLKLK